MITELSYNAAEAIPYKNFKEMSRIVRLELKENRYVEIWDKYIYSAERWGKEVWEKLNLGFGIREMKLWW